MPEECDTKGLRPLLTIRFYRRTVRLSSDLGISYRRLLIIVSLIAALTAGARLPEVLAWPHTMLH